MGYDNRCTICRGVGSRFSGGVRDRCSVCEGRGYIQPVSTFTFIKMLYYLAGLIAICGLCGYCALGRGERWRGPHADSMPGAAGPPVGRGYVTVAPERFQRRYDVIVHVAVRYRSPPVLIRFQASEQRMAPRFVAPDRRLLPRT
jgi:hypothetical protein